MEPVNLKTELRQELKLTPQLLQFTELLQMNSLELGSHLERILEENPVLEREEGVLQKEIEELRNKASWVETSGRGGSQVRENFLEQGRPDSEPESLKAFLRDQLERKRLPKALLALTKYFVELLDEDGFLADEDLEDVLSLDIPPELIQEALKLLQSLEPAGVGARSLTECLLLQLARRGEDAPVVRAVVVGFLPELAKKRYGLIARELEVTTEEIRAAEKLIVQLDPYPGRAFVEVDPVYIQPDVFLAEVDGEWKVVLNEIYLPRVYISDYYMNMLQESDERETKDYLREKVRQAKWLMYSLSQRGDTLRRCVQTIFEMQKEFFTGTSSELNPMRMDDLAEKLNLNKSTISRAIRGKYLQCRQGTYPLRYFFNRAVSDGTSRHAVKQKILQLMKTEDPAHPLSDQKLCELLMEDGVQVSRRAVAKYRLELGVASSTARKRTKDTI